MLSGAVPNDSAIFGSAVASTVPSSCSMNMALATISATVRGLGPSLARRVLALRRMARRISALTKAVAVLRSGMRAGSRV